MIKDEKEEEDDDLENDCVTRIIGMVKREYDGILSWCKKIKNDDEQREEDDDGHNLRKKAWPELECAQMMRR